LNHGDFAATLPGGYAEQLNPRLWNSQDLEGSWAFHKHSYLHGPTQFLTLYPVAFLDSYTAIARLLLFIYPIAILAGVLVLCRALDATDGRRTPRSAVYASTLLFYPLIQAFSQREFEIVIFLAVAVMLWAAVRDQQEWLGGAVAYVTWFKYLPIVLVPYLAIRGCRRAVVWFAACSAIILLLAHLLFDLRHFVDNQVPSVAGGHLAAIVGAVDFCQGTEPRYRFGNQTFASVRWAFCTLENEGLTIRPLVAYLTCAAIVAYVSILGFVRLERLRPLPPASERWRRVLELSLMVSVYTTFFFAHYYYLTVLAVPLAVLLVRFLRERRWGSLALWSGTYACLSVFTIPIGVVDRLLHLPSGELVAWTWYMRHVLYLPGELGLQALLLGEYLRIE
jgi:glycosyl transferase family 87